MQDWLKRVARNAKVNDQDVSLWIWGAEFSHYGWVDHSLVCTPSDGHTAFGSPRVRKGFEKYCVYYAELAPLLHRLVADFYDPVNLTTRQNIFNYTRLLEGTFKDKNPEVKVSIDMWAADADYFPQLFDNGFRDYVVPEQPYWLKLDQQEAINREVKGLGVWLGMWGWCSAEMETSQLPSIYFNTQVVKEVY